MKDNELIAEFIGFELVDGKDKYMARWVKQTDGLLDPYFGPYSADHLKFDASWDWLMPVVEKIESLGFEFAISQNKAMVMNDYRKIPEPITLEKLPAHKRFEYESSGTEGTKIQCVYLTVIEFVRWYNTLEPKTEKQI